MKSLPFFSKHGAKLGMGERGHPSGALHLKLARLLRIWRAGSFRQMSLHFRIQGHEVEGHQLLQVGK